MTSILDNMISYRFAQALRALEKDVRGLREEFQESTPDEHWIATLGQRGWAFVTLDMRIRSKPLERATLRQARITSFFLGPFFYRLGFWEQGVWLISRWPKFEAVVHNFTRGTCLSVQQNGKMRPLPPV